MGLFSALGSIGGVIGGLLGKKSDQELQKDFAKKGIQWRVADANKAGIHPLAALGANTISYSPVGVGSDLPALGESLGAGLDRAQAAAGTSGQRARQMEDLSLERAGLENDLLRSQIAQINRPHVGPAMQSLDGSDGTIKLVPPQQTPNMRLFGKDYKTNPGFVDAQSVEDRYGDSEILSTVTALVNMGADGYTIMKNLVSRPEFFRPPKYGPTRSGYKARYLKGY